MQIYCILFQCSSLFCQSHRQLVSRLMQVQEDRRGFGFVPLVGDVRSERGNIQFTQYRFLRLSAVRACWRRVHRCGGCDAQCDHVASGDAAMPAAGGAGDWCGGRDSWWGRSKYFHIRYSVPAPAWDLPNQLLASLAFLPLKLFRSFLLFFFHASEVFDGDVHRLVRALSWWIPPFCGTVPNLHQIGTVRELARRFR